jgi:hypothetical protein
VLVREADSRGDFLAKNVEEAGAVLEKHPRLSDTRLLDIVSSLTYLYHTTTPCRI